MIKTTATAAERIARERQAHADQANYSPAEDHAAAGYRVDPFNADRPEPRTVAAMLAPFHTAEEARADAARRRTERAALLARCQVR